MVVAVAMSFTEESGGPEHASEVSSHAPTIGAKEWGPRQTSGLRAEDVDDVKSSELSV